MTVRVQFEGVGMELTLEQAREILDAVEIADDCSGKYSDLIDILADEISGMEREQEGK